MEHIPYILYINVHASLSIKSSTKTGKLKNSLKNKTNCRMIFDNGTCMSYWTCKQFQFPVLMVINIENSVLQKYIVANGIKVSIAF